ncbi:MAG: aminopeptidase [Thermodesulfobacteriota bacterium]
MMTRPRCRTLCLFFLALVLASCSTRSISNSGYRAGEGWSGADNPLYQGELSEFDVLGISRGSSVTEEEITGALADHRPVSLRKGSTVLVIQSGAMLPDQPLVAALERDYAVAGFSGVPPAVAKGEGKEPAAQTSYFMALRLAAARGGTEKVVVVWGVLETAQEDLVTRAVSWVPVVGWALPDQRQQMRIRLKVAVIDVASGRWALFLTPPVTDEAVSAFLGRQASDQEQVALLKDKAYVALADELATRFGR